MPSEQRKVLVKFCEGHGLDFEIVRRKRHEQAIVLHGGKKHRFTLAGTPSDRRGTLNLVADLRRSLDLRERRV